jgi:hypothetical protein
MMMILMLDWSLGDSKWEMIYKINNKAMKFVKLFENWMEDEDNDQTAYVDAPVAHAGMHVGDEEMAPEIEGEDSYEADSEAAAAEETYADGIGYDDSEVEEEEEAENEEE